jgi:hypothetical protein
MKTNIQTMVRMANAVFLLRRNVEKGLKAIAVLALRHPPTARILGRGLTLSLIV